METTTQRREQSNRDQCDMCSARAHTKRVLGVRRSNLLLCLYTLTYLVYLLAGGIVFAALEAPEELALKTALIKARASFLATNPCVSGMEFNS